MSKLILLSVLYLPFILPIWAAGKGKPKAALRLVVLYVALFYFLAGLAIRFYVAPRIWS